MIMMVRVYASEKEDVTPSVALRKFRRFLLIAPFRWDANLSLRAIYCSSLDLRHDALKTTECWKDCFLCIQRARKALFMKEMAIKFLSY